MTSRISRRAWNPRALGWYAFFFGVIPVGFLHVKNWSRLGYPEKQRTLAVNLFFTVCIYVAILFIIEGLLGELLVFLINSAYSYYFSRSQKKAFEAFIASGGKKAKWYSPLPVIIAIDTAVIIVLLCLLGGATVDDDWGQYRDPAADWIYRTDEEVTEILSDIQTESIGRIDTVAEIQCPAPVVGMAVQDRLIFAELSDGSIAVYDETGAFVSSLDLQLYIPEAIRQILSDTTSLNLCKEPDMTLIEVEPTTRSDWVKVDTRSSSLVVIRNDFGGEYAYEPTEKIWWAVKHVVRWLAGTRSTLEILNYQTMAKRFTHSFYGMTMLAAIDANRNLVAFVYQTDFHRWLRVVDMQTGNILYDETAPEGVTWVFVDADSLYVGDESYIHVYSLGDGRAVNKEAVTRVDARVVTAVQVLHRNSSQRPAVIWTDRYEGIIGPWRYIADSSMYEVCSALDRKGYYPITYSTEEGELLLRDRDTVYTVNFEARHTTRYALDSCSLLCTRLQALSSRTYVGKPRWDELIIFTWTPETQ